MKEASRSHLVLIPSYNPGERVYETVQAARRFWNPVWVVVDASTDGTAEGLRKRARADPGLKVIVLPRNGGSRFHARPDDGFGRPAPGRDDR